MSPSSRLVLIQLTDLSIHLEISRACFIAVSLPHAPPKYSLFCFVLAHSPTTMLCCLKYYIAASDLYHTFDLYLRDQVLELEAAAHLLTGGALLTLYLRQWKRYSLVARRLNNIFEPLNVFLLRDYGYGRWHSNVYTLLMVRWKQGFFLKVEVGIRCAIAEAQRDGERVILARAQAVEEALKHMEFDENDRYLLLKAPVKVTDQSSKGARE